MASPTDTTDEAVSAQGNTHGKPTTRARVILKTVALRETAHEELGALRDLLLEQVGELPQELLEIVRSYSDTGAALTNGAVVHTAVRHLFNTLTRKTDK